MNDINLQRCSSQGTPTTTSPEGVRRWTQLGLSLIEPIVVAFHQSIAKYPNIKRYLEEHRTTCFLIFKIQIPLPCPTDRGEFDSVRGPGLASPCPPEKSLTSADPNNLPEATAPWR